SPRLLWIALSVIAYSADRSLLEVEVRYNPTAASMIVATAMIAARRANNAMIADPFGGNSRASARTRVSKPNGISAGGAGAAAARNKRSRISPGFFTVNLRFVCATSGARERLLP